MSIGLKLIDARISFSNSNILDHINLTIPAGEATVIIGPAASGKSILFKYILDLLDGQEPKLTFLNMLNEKVEPQPGQVGVMFQENALFDSMTARENISFQIVNTLSYPKLKALKVANKLLSEMGLSVASGDKYPSELSGGMQKRVALARALSSKPKLLMLDEPTAGLDPVLTVDICSLIKAKTQSEDITLLAITSDIQVALTYFDNLVLLEDGGVVWTGKASAINLHEDRSINRFLRGE